MVFRWETIHCAPGKSQGGIMTPVLFTFRLWYSQNIFRAIGICLTEAQYNVNYKEELIIIYLTCSFWNRRLPCSSSLDDAQSMYKNPRSKKLSEPNTLTDVGVLCEQKLFEYWCNLNTTRWNGFTSYWLAAVKYFWKNCFMQYNFTSSKARDMIFLKEK